jgi:hypothetical protein
LGTSRSGSEENLLGKARSPAVTILAAAAAPVPGAAAGAPPASAQAAAAAAVKQRKPLFAEWDQYLPREERRTMPVRDAWLRGLRTQLPTLAADAVPLPRPTPARLAELYVIAGRYLSSFMCLSCCSGGGRGGRGRDCVVRG